MATNILVPLTNSRGLNKIIFFSGLQFPVVIVPSLIGEPMLTAQPFYFIERLESVARVRFELSEEVPTEREIEHVVDNYLFEYSKSHPESKLTSKISEMIFWQIDPFYHYFKYDWQLAEYLVLDTLNDSSIVDCSDSHHSDKDAIDDWCLFKIYFDEAIAEYQNKLSAAMDIKATVTTEGHSSLGTGTLSLPIFKSNGNILSLQQVEMFEVVEPGKPKPRSTFYEVSRGIHSDLNFIIQQELFSCTSYRDEHLLAYYFSALRDSSPVSQFKNYYNILEFFFEASPQGKGAVSNKEIDQLEATLRWAVSAAELVQRVGSLPMDLKKRLVQPRPTSSGEVIQPLILSAQDFIKEYARHSYELRNACLHSKRTRAGILTSRIAPSTAEESILSDDIDVMRWLAIKCIEKA